MPDVPEDQLSSADDSVNLNSWVPPQSGISPHLRIGKRWFNTLWLIPLGVVLLITGIAISQELRQIPVVEQFIALYPGTLASAPAVNTGFPVWLRWQHFLNLFFMMFIIRAGLQILADHPRLYWRRDSPQIGGASGYPSYDWLGKMVALFL